MIYVGVRGKQTNQSSMLCLMSPEDRIPARHPLRKVKALADETLRMLSPVFDRMYASEGRPSIPPERLLKSMVLIAFYSVRSERLFCEQLDYNMLFRWFLDMDMVAESFDASTFSKNRARLMEHEVAAHFLGAVVERARAERLISDEHFSVDGTLIEAWASLKSFRPKDEDDDGEGGGDSNRWTDFHGQKRSNATHESKTDPEAKLMRKGLGKEAKLCFSGHVLMENRNGLVVDFRIAEANGKAEREVALQMLDEALPGDKRITVGADKGYDTGDFIARCREMNVTPHVAQCETAHRRSMIDERTTRHGGYYVSQTIRKRIEEIFGWMKTVGNFRRSRLKGIARSQMAAYFAGAAYNLLRMAKLLETSA